MAVYCGTLKAVCACIVRARVAPVKWLGSNLWYSNTPPLFPATRDWHMLPPPHNTICLLPFLPLKPGEMLTLTDQRRYQPPPPHTHTPPTPHLFCVDVRGWQRSRADDCIHASAHWQRSSPAERKLHTLSAAQSSYWLTVLCLQLHAPVRVWRSLFLHLFFSQWLILHSAHSWIINSVVL